MNVTMTPEMNVEQAQPQKRKVGRPKLTTAERMNRLKILVDSLQEMFGDGPYNREQVVKAAGSNSVGLTLFTSKRNGYGTMTRVQHGLYKIPDEWKTSNFWATWNKE